MTLASVTQTRKRVSEVADVEDLLYYNSLILYLHLKHKRVKTDNTDGQGRKAARAALD